MLQPANRRPPYTRLEWIGVIIAATFVVSTLANLVGCHADELRECEEQRGADIVRMTGYQIDDYKRISALEDQASANDSAVIAAELHGHDQGLLDCHERAKATAKVWPKVLSVFTSTDPDKPDMLAGKSSAWKLPPGPVTMANMVPRGTPADAVPKDWDYRKVRHDDFGIALRGVVRYTRAEVCQAIDGAKCCAIGPAVTTGPWGALCRRPEDCTPGKKCERQIGDSTRPGDETEYWYTTAKGGPCEHRGAVDVTPAFRDVCGFRAMRPVTVRLL